MLLCHTHRWMHCLVISSEAFSRSIWEWLQRPTTRHFADRESKLEKVFIRSQPLEKRKFHGTVGKKNIAGVRVAQRKPGEHDLLNPASRARMFSQSLKWQAQGLCGSAPGHLNLCYGYWLDDFARLLNGGGYFWLLCLFLRPFFSYWVALSILHKRAFTLPHCVILSCLAVISWRPAFFWGRNRRGVGLGKRELGRQLEGVDTVVRIYCLREDSIFNKSFEF